MQVLTLKDGTKITINNCIDPREIIAVCDSETDAIAVAGEVTDANLKKFTIGFSDGSDLQTFGDMKLERAPMRSATSDGKVAVYLWLRPESLAEIASDKFSERIQTNTTDITNIELALVELYESKEDAANG